MSPKDIVLQHVQEIERGAWPAGELFAALHFLRSHSHHAEARRFERRLNALASKAIREHLVDIKNHPFCSDRAAKSVNRFVHSLSQPNASAADAYGKLLSALRARGLSADAEALQNRSRLWFELAIRGDLNQIKESPFADARASA